MKQLSIPVAAQQVDRVLRQVIHNREEVCPKPRAVRSGSPLDQRSAEQECVLKKAGS
jgi:hypothetical protein